MNPIHQPSLYRFLHRLLKPWKGGGRVATRDLREGPSQLTSLMKNMSLIATDMSPALRRAGAKSARTPTIDLWFDPSFDGNDSRMGGRVGIQAQHAVGNPNNHLYVNYGFLLDLTLASRRIDWRIFGEVSGSELRRNKAKNCGKESVFVSQRSGTLFNRMDLKKAAINQRISALLVEALNGVDAMKLVTTTPHRHQLALIRKALSA